MQWLHNLVLSDTLSDDGVAGSTSTVSGGSCNGMSEPNMETSLSSCGMAGCHITIAHQAAWQDVRQIFKLPSFSLTLWAAIDSLLPPPL